MNNRSLQFSFLHSTTRNRSSFRFRPNRFCRCSNLLGEMGLCSFLWRTWNCVFNRVFIWYLTRSREAFCRLLDLFTACTGEWSERMNGAGPSLFHLLLLLPTPSHPRWHFLLFDRLVLMLCLCGLGRVILCRFYWINQELFEGRKRFSIHLHSVRYITELGFDLVFIRMLWMKRLLKLTAILVRTILWRW